MWSLHFLLSVMLLDSCSEWIKKGSVKFTCLFFSLNILKGLSFLLRDSRIYETQGTSWHPKSISSCFKRLCQCKLSMQCYAMTMLTRICGLLSVCRCQLSWKKLSLITMELSMCCCIIKICSHPDIWCLELL